MASIGAEPVLEINIIALSKPRIAKSPKGLGQWYQTPSVGI